MNTIPCHRCGFIGEPIRELQTHANGVEHIRASCRNCGRFIKWLPQNKVNKDDFMFYFGKHKGKMASLVAEEDSGYLKWLLENHHGLKIKQRNIIQKLLEGNE